MPLTANDILWCLFTIFMIDVDVPYIFLLPFLFLIPYQIIIVVIGYTMQVQSLVFSGCISYFITIENTNIVVQKKSYRNIPLLYW